MCLYSYLTSILTISSIFFLPLPFKYTSFIHISFIYSPFYSGNFYFTSSTPFINSFLLFYWLSKYTLFDFSPFISIPFYLPTHLHNVLFIASKYSNHNIPPFWTPTGQIFHSSGFPHGLASLFYFQIVKYNLIHEITIGLTNCRSHYFYYFTTLYSFNT